MRPDLVVRVAGTGSIVGDLTLAFGVGVGVTGLSWAIGVGVGSDDVRSAGAGELSSEVVGIGL